MSHKFQVNLRGVIDLLSEHLYSGPDVYVRELMQNAVDAITARMEAEPGFAGEVLVECHAPKGKPPSVVFTNNGIGLTADDVHTFLATIGQSSKKKSAGRPVDFIGQFGIGILSCFVVSEEIVVISKSARDPAGKPVEWRARPDGTYDLKELDRDFAPGTQVWLTAKPGVEELFSAEKVIELCRHFGGLLPYPVRIQAGRGTATVNADGPPWRRTFRTDGERNKALLAFGREAFGIDFFDAVPMASKAGKVDGVAFVLPYAPSQSRKQTHRIYLKNMFLSDAGDNLLPDWAFFVQAVVNANDLRPTASRESFYEDAKLSSAREALGECLRNYLVELAEKRPEKLAKFIDLHHRSLKALAAEDDEFFAVVIDWLPFETTHGRMPFGEYRKAYGRVRYLTDIDSFRQIARVAAAQGDCVINAGYVYEPELMAKAADVFPDLEIEAVDPQALAQEFEDLDSECEALADAFLPAAEKALRPFRCRADARSFRPDDLPALYTTSREGRFLRSLEQSKEVAPPAWAGVLD